MKKLIYYSILILSFNYSFSQDYFLENFGPYDENIQSPEEFLGYEIGDQHTRHDLILAYFKYLSSISEKADLITYGKSYEGRLLTLLSISQTENLKNLENIKKEHLKSTMPGSIKTINENLPVIINLGYGIHGNEPSGSEAALLTAYTLVASENKKITQLVTNSVVFIDPTLNPDGRDRHSQWANQYKSINLVADSNDAEHNESWPRGRTNHYWFDMNRDWLPVQLNESKARIASFTEWMPNVLTDHHEMGTNSTFFFQPGIQSRVNPLTPKRNQELTIAIGKYHAEALNEIGSLYYSEEDYDDFYYGKGSTYPDVNGAIGILFEQASSRGHAQESDNGILTFPFTIRNQFVTALSTLKAASGLRTELLNFQRDFFNTARAEGEKNRDKALVFGNEKDVATAYRLSEVLLRHDIKVHRLNKNVRKDGKRFPKESSFIVPLNQKKQRLVRAIFSEQKQFQDSLFYDVSAWTLSHAFDVNTTKMRDLNAMGEALSGIENPPVKTVKKASYAYLFEGHGYYTPKAIYALLEAGIRVKVGLQPFSLDGKKYDYGTLMVPVANQTLNEDELYALMQKVADNAFISIHSTSTGLTQGIDLGSRNFETIQLPKVALLVGDGVRSYDAGEIWHLMDTQYNMPVTKIDVKSIARRDLSRYTHLVVPSYNGSLLGKAKQKIASWVKNGGHLIAYRDAVKWANNNEFVKEEFRESDLTAEGVSFVDRQRFNGAQAIGGAIFNATIDRSHPINFGIEDSELALFRNSRIFMEPDKNSYNNPIRYTNEPVLSGYISEEQLALLKGSVPFKVKRSGRGKILLMTDNTNFRAFWLGTQQLYANMLFYADFM